MGPINFMLLVGMTGFACLAVFVRDLVRAALSLAFMSALLAVLLYRLASPYAAVFELSVVAGLITVLFVSTIALTKEDEETKPSGWPLYVFALTLVIFGLLDLSIMKALFTSAPAGAGNPAGGFGYTLWGIRSLDMLGQVAVIFGGVFGVLALLREPVVHAKKEQGGHA
jgi:NADH-quinone oxidoreductase subunit J